MQSGLFYLAASLPYLQFSAKPGITSGQFIDECAKWLNPQDLAVVVSARLRDHGQDEGAGILKMWKAYNTELTTEIVTARKENAQSGTQANNSRLKQMFDAENPLLIEMAYEKKRWIYLEEMEFGHDFDIDFLIIYYLKLQILERLNLFVKEKGRQSFDKLCEVKYA